MNEIDEETKKLIIKEHVDKIKSRIDNWREYNSFFGKIITDSSELVTELSKYAASFFSSLNLENYPRHTIICLPEMASPVAFHNSHLICLFAGSINQYLFQYAHELCHIVLGPFPQKLKWFAELLCCSCSYFYLDEKNISQSIDLEKDILELKQNLNNYLAIKDLLTSNPTAVYSHETHQFEALIWSYFKLHTEFSFIDLLSRARLSAHSNQGLNDIVLETLELFQRQ